MTRLEPLSQKSRLDYDGDPYLRDIVERNLEVAAQCCIDICHRIVALERAQKPADAHEAILRMGELGVLEPWFAKQLAPIAGFRNILVHEYLGLNWDEIYSNLQRMEDFRNFADAVGFWMRQRQ
ncbi:MAG: type VII toxin-antitoxin system HepT family RNase toxin [Desulfovermiculus sp.]